MVRIEEEFIVALLLICFFSRGIQHVSPSGKSHMDGFATFSEGHRQMLSFGWDMRIRRSIHCAFEAMDGP